MSGVRTWLAPALLLVLLAGCAAPWPGQEAPVALPVPAGPGAQAPATPAQPTLPLAESKDGEPLAGSKDGEPLARSEGDEPLARGLASWYGPGLHGRRTASGERFDRQAYTAAHRELPFGTRLCVRSLLNAHTVVVRVNDRGPFAEEREIDLSEAAARQLGMLGLGLKPVELWRLAGDETACPQDLPALDAARQPPLARQAGLASAGKKARKPRRK